MVLLLSSKEIINVHCLAHRLELSFRDVLKNNKLYEKLMTLLIGLHYFYMKYYKNKSGLQSTIKALNIKGCLPPKMTGTRWLPHLSRGIDSLLKLYPAYEAHLSSASHTNPKAEGLVKVMLDKNLTCFVLFLKVTTNYVYCFNSSPNFSIIFMITIIYFDN